MVFNSLTYLIFFPVVVLAYYLLPVKFRYIWLLGASYFFYMQWDAIYGLLLLYSTAVAYAGGQLLGRLESIKQRKLCLALCLLLDFSPLICFKYSAFLLSTVNILLQNGGIAPLFSIPDLILPIGISFFTFQASGYVIDVYKKTVPPEHNFLRFALFVSFFPQLVAGPIERTKNLLSQLDCKASFDFDKTRDGLWLMLWGYLLKVVIADRIAIFVDTVYADLKTYDGAYILIATALFAFQIYCDFAGYSAIAIGSAQILGIRLMDNFASPYLSISVSEFWRRWHISLTSWFKDYVYIPMGGNRRGKLRTFLNRLFVFTLSGLWHGADWTFAIWGALNGFLLILEDILHPVMDRLSRLLGIKCTAISNRVAKGIITFFLVDFTWIFFRAGSVSNAVYIISSLKSFPRISNINIFFGDGLYECGLDEKNFHFLILMIALLLIIDTCSKMGIVIRNKIAVQNLWFRSFFTVFAIIFILVFGIWGGSYEKTAFIYFQF